MRADRLIRLLMLLQRHREITSARLAQELEVSERTVLRDMEALAAAGVPVFTERGRGGGCRLIDGYTTRATGLTPGETQALFGWHARAAATDLGLAPELASALAKIAATAPAGAVAQAEDLGAVILADRRRWYASGDDVPWLPTLRDAALRHRKIRVRYQSSEATQPSERTVDPIGLVDHSGRWYLLAEHRGRRRTYRVSRITHADVLDDPAVVIDQRPLAQQWEQARLALEEQLNPVAVTVAVACAAAGKIRRLIAMNLAPGTDIATAAAPDADGWEIWTFQVLRPQVLAATAILFAAEIEVQAPLSMRTDIAHGAAVALQRYG